jgi:PAS domain S-box-containing protein
MGWLDQRLKARPRLRRVLIWAATAVGLAAFTALMFGVFDLPRQQRVAAERVEHTLQVLEATSVLEADLARALSRARGYIIAGKADNRARAETSAEHVVYDLSTLTALTGEPSVQRSATDNVRDLIESRLALLHKDIALKAAGDEDAGRLDVLSDAGHDLMVKINAALGAIRADEKQRLGRQQREAEAAMRWVVAALVASGAVAAVSGLGATTLLLGRRQERASLAELRRTEALLRTIMETAPGLIFAKDLQGWLILANTAVRAFLGKPWPEIEGRTDREFLDDPAEGEAIMANDRRIIASGRTQVLEEYAGTQGDRPRVWLSTKTPMRDADGTIVGLVGVSVEITERKRTEERLQAFNAELEANVATRTGELAASEARQRAYFDHSPIGMVVMGVRTDGDFMLEDLNPAARAAFGFAPDSVHGLKQWELWPELVARDKQEKMRACARHRQTIAYTVAREIRGRTRTLDVVLAPILDESREARHVLICVEDVTERERTETARRQGQKMEAIGALAAGVAHDFNNILQVVTGSLDLVMEEAGYGTPAHEFAATALNAALRGSQLTHHLLSYARKQMLLPQTIDLASFLAEIETLLARTLGPHIAIDLTVLGTPRAQADPGELQTALLNLAINAAYAMPKGGTLRIAAHEEHDAGTSWVGIALTDTGAGMDAATLARAVEPFFTTKGVGGTGLGLSMVQGFAEQSGGTLRIDSPPGHGTKVTLRLPAAATAAPAQVLPAAPAAPASGRILLVDDSTDVLVTVGAFLEKAGFVVTRAEHGDRALAILGRDRRFDALVSDYAMPGLNGLDLVMRARSLSPGLPALIITGYAALGDAETEGTAVLHKPFQRHELLAALARVMRRETATATAPRA